MDPNAVVCIHCGVAKGTGDKFCPNCGTAAGAQAAFCMQCGASLNNTAASGGTVQKSRLVAGLLGIFLGCFGVHNFYLGYTGKAVAQLLISVLSCGILAFGSAIWGLIEGILILTGSNITTDAKGIPLGE